MKISSHVTHPHMMATFLMNDISRICRQLVDQRMRHVGLTRAQWFFIYYVFLYDGLSQQELADLTDLGRSGVGKQVQKLEQKGWIRRGPHEGNRRSFRIYMTEEMRPTVEKLNALAEICLQSVLGRLKESEARKLIRMLQEVDRQLESERQNAPALPEADRLVEEICVELKRKKSTKKNQARKVLGPNTAKA